MDIKRIVRKHLLEAKISRDTEEFLANIWPGLSTEDINRIYNWFDSIKGNLPLDPEKVKGGLLSFLEYYNGSSPKREKFEIKNIRDIKSYSLDQIKRLYHELKNEKLVFGTEEEPELPVDKIFYENLGEISVTNKLNIKSVVTNPDSSKLNDKDKNTITELIEKSKQLWYGQKFLVYENDGFRVYECPDQITSVAFGWYVYYIRYFYDYGNNPWCTSNPQLVYNLFRSKRGDRSFYFVIDESKFPQTRDNSRASRTDGPNFFLSVLQIMSPNSYLKYKLTGIHNPGEIIYDKENLLKLYPKLKDFIESDKSKYVPFSPTEMADKKFNPITMINEIEGDEYEFAIRPPDEKIDYINAPGTYLTKGRSWKSMNKTMKRQYIVGTLDRDNLFTKFSTSDLFNELSVSEKNTLNNQINIIKPNEGGIKLIVNNIMKNDYYVDERKSLDKDYLSLYKSRSSGKFGIFNLNEEKWVNYDGITYDDRYRKLDNKTSFYRTNDNTMFTVIVYSDSTEENDKSFYVLVPIKSKFDGYFLSAKKWEELKLKVSRELDNPEKTNTEYDPNSDDTDINEKWGN